MPQPEEEQSFLSSIGSFLWTAVKWIAVAGLVVTGAVFFSDKANDWVNRITGNEPGKGWGNSIREFFEPAKRKLAELKEGLLNPKKEEDNKKEEDKPLTPVEEIGHDKAQGYKAAAGFAGVVTAVKIVKPAATAAIEAAKVAGDTLKVSGVVNGVTTGLRESKEFLVGAKNVQNSVAAVDGTIDAATGAMLTPPPKTVGKVAGELVETAGPKVKAGAKFLGRLSGVVTAYEGAKNTGNLWGEGHRRSAIFEAVGSGIETAAQWSSKLPFIGQATGWITIPAASGAHDLISVTDTGINYLVEGKAEQRVSTGAVSTLINDTGLGEKLGYGLAYPILYWRGQTEGQLKEQEKKTEDHMQRNAEQKIKSLNDEDKARFIEIKKNLQYNQPENASDWNALLTLVEERPNALKKLGADMHDHNVNIAAVGTLSGQSIADGKAPNTTKGKNS